MPAITAAVLTLFLSAEIFFLNPEKMEICVILEADC